VKKKKKKKKEKEEVPICEENGEEERPVGKETARKG
jgi:hypothetical protein